MTSLRAALAEGTARLKAAGVPEPARDARRLMAAALGLAPERLVLAPEALPQAAAAAFARMVGERARFRPVGEPRRMSLKTPGAPRNGLPTKTTRRTYRAPAQEGESVAGPEPCRR